MSKHIFRFRQFEVKQENAAHKVGTDAMILGSYIDASEAMNILDIGTGTGVLALMLAQQGEAIVDAVELDEITAEEATFNFENSPWHSRLNIYRQDFRAFSQDESIHYDLMVCNPPFFEEINENKGNNSQLPGERRKRARFTGSLSFKELFEGVQRLLVTYGRFYLIIPPLAEKQVLENAHLQKMFLTEKLEIKSFAGEKPVRLVLCFQKAAESLKESELVIYEREGLWTTDYKNLTQAYHLVS